jgi:glycosyltransferase involved in cell wall biosynthesis
MSDKVSAVVPCLFVNSNFVTMTATAMQGLYTLHELLVIGSGRGYAENVNVGLAASTGDTLLVANNDIEFVQPDWLDHLLKPLHNGYDIASIRTTEPDGWSTEDKITDNDKFGSIWAMTRHAYETLGPLDERFGKGYFDDLDYWHRAQDAGLKIAKNHAGLVEHKGKATFAVIDGKDELYGINMFKYKEKWGDRAFLVEQKPDEVVLVDWYDYIKYTPGMKASVDAKSITLDYAKQKWGQVW